MTGGGTIEWGLTHTFHGDGKQGDVIAWEGEMQSLSKTTDAFLMGESISFDSQTGMCYKPPPLLETTMDPVFKASRTEKGREETCEFSASSGQLLLQEGSEDAAGVRDAHAPVAFTLHQPRATEATPIAESAEAPAGSVMHDIIHAQMNFPCLPKLTSQSRPRLISPQKPNATRAGGLIPSSSVFSMSPGAAASFTPLKTALNVPRNRAPRISYFPPKTWNAHPANNVSRPHAPAKDTSSMPLPDNSGGGEGSVMSSSRSPFVLKQPSLSMVGVRSLSSSSRNSNIYIQESTCSVSMPRKVPSTTTEYAGGNSTTHHLCLPEFIASVNKGSCCTTSRGGANSNASGTAGTQSSKLQQQVQSMPIPLLVSSNSNDSRVSEKPLPIAKTGRNHRPEAVFVSGRRFPPQNDLGNGNLQAMVIVPTRFGKTDYSHGHHQSRHQQGTKMHNVQEVLMQEVVSQLRDL
ncbi:hypothetical protein TraAM80_05113 [Trypanosoma rangeli]|uniref:Uncharacterized protein n=1 Tax=Trypanosoma rangeli TaxID=5698 RepID=A0A3R7KZI0_TRYRA|nr:uncharacterized protein TraAM80_05113 [Trypanosoma rangeli]RNF04521.1 hypothetical protein TraAM80_05113 [Trypanosoma rangeli]|eukprot:RNF04521.1 hypothetical protein TraAM80_05113 [Trypanosoma rangeli]